MAKIDSPEALKNYALRALGAPVINIEIDDEQCYDRIDDVLQKFVDNHYAGSVEKWMMVTVTANDIARGYITLADEWVSLIDIGEPIGIASQVEEFENFNFRLANSDFFSQIFQGGTADVLSYQVFQEKIDMFGRYFSPSRRFRFNHLSHRLEAQGTWKAGYRFLVHGYHKVDPEESVDVYNDAFVKKYAVALIGRQWGANVSKYEGVQLAGGVTMRGEAIYDRYEEMAKEIEESFSSKYELPPDFTIA